MAPFKTHTAFDYEKKNHLSYLSRARSVIGKIEALLIEKGGDVNFSAMSVSASRERFAIGFNELCSYLSPDMNQQQLDIRHYGDAMYVSFYDRMLRDRKKRKLAALNAEVNAEV